MNNSNMATVPVKKKHIAVILPVGYSGGSLRGAKLLAEAILIGSRLCGEEVRVTLAYLDDLTLNSDNEFLDLCPDVSVRQYKWKILDSGSARRAMAYSGQMNWVADNQRYCVPDDGVNQFLDCDLWVIISDRINTPLLPIRPYILMVYDYIQRYISFLSPEAEQAYINAARGAKAVLVTTDFTRQDALQYAGVKPECTHKLPMLIPEFTPPDMEGLSEDGEDAYFIYTTNTAKHKNNENAFIALKIYYEELAGELSCHITGFNTENLTNNTYPHLTCVSNIYSKCPLVKAKVILFGELSDRVYQKKLRNASFLWHTSAIDNGTFSVIEAAQFGVSSLSTDYPAMREIDSQFKLNLTWMDADNPEQMARQLKWMEGNYKQMRRVVSDNNVIRDNRIENAAIDYWKVVQSCL